MYEQVNNLDTRLETRNLTISEYPALFHFVGILDINFVQRINRFWLNFEPPSATSHYTIAGIYSILLLFGSFGNFLVIYMFARCKSLRTPANILIINLAVSDFLLISKGVIAINNSLQFGPAFGELGCKIYGFIGGLTGTASITTLTAISIDRYNVIVYPLNPLKSSTIYRIRIMVAIVWIYSFIFAVLPLLNIGFSAYVPEGFLTTCSFDYLSKSYTAKVYIVSYFVGAWCVPFSIISYCYFYILKVVISANSIQSSKDKNKTEMKLATVVLAIIALWFTAWTPYAIIALLGIFNQESKLSQLGSMAPAIFCKVGAGINPYVYAVTHPKFRAELRQTFFGRLIERGATYSTSSAKYKTSSCKRNAEDDTEDQVTVQKTH